jgi:hypothetical protein
MPPKPKEERHNIRGRLQYQTIEEGEAAQAWLVAYLAEHAADVGHGGNEKLRELKPPHPEGCVCEYRFRVFFETETYEEFNAHRVEIERMIYQGPVMGGIATADCLSGINVSTHLNVGGE